MCGVDLEMLKSNFDCDLIKENQLLLERYTHGEFVKIEDHRLLLTEKGKLLADQISAELFLDNEQTEPGY